MIVAMGVSAALTAAAPYLVDAKSILRHWFGTLYPLGIMGAFAVVFAVQANLHVLDKAIYTRELRAVAGQSLGHALLTPQSLATSGEPGYVTFLWLVGRIGTSTACLYTCVSIVGLIALIVAARLLLPSHQVPLFVLITLSLGVFTAYTGLVLRQGLSMAALLIAVTLILRGSAAWKWSLALGLAITFHWSCVPIAVVIAFCALCRFRLAVPVVAWVIAALLFVTHSQHLVVGPIAGLVPKLTDYTSAAANLRYAGGTDRLDFLLFSAAFLGLGLVFRRLTSIPPWYDRLLVIYTCTNIYFLLFGFIAYSDRLASYSWSLVPLIVLAPLTRRVQSPTVVLSVLVGSVAMGFVLGPFASMIGLTPFPDGTL